MKKDYSKVIYKRSGRSEFLSIRAELEKKIARGHTLAEIYDLHASVFSFGYSQFTRYVARYCQRARRIVMCGSQRASK